jgi:hypothetical protein
MSVDRIMVMSTLIRPEELVSVIPVSCVTRH